MIQRSHDEMVATARVAGAELDHRYVKLAADAMAVWWDEVVAVREIDLGGMAHPSPLEPRTAPLVHPKHRVPTSNGAAGPAVSSSSSNVSAPTDLADCTVTELLGHFAAGTASPSEALAACVARIEKIDDRINSVMHVALEAATRQAQQSDQIGRAHV